MDVAVSKSSEPVSEGKAASSTILPDSISERQMSPKRMKVEESEAQENQDHCDENYDPERKHNLNKCTSKIQTTSETNLVSHIAQVGFYI